MATVIIQSDPSNIRYIQYRISHWPGLYTPPQLTYKDVPLNVNPFICRVCNFIISFKYIFA